ncbi:M1 family metallopeptidase [Fulvivirga lutimaris]|uniref:M1 family metallopeptidase n=1 Tax=Fulvivirga lutimaris TaxID=1819566 RepID=UPI0012BBE655|nr:M1 family aminopeptidase [Fulvivirga lutimaris]MTI39451.1 peptidase M1 [Fulvivirga lutimaris]
MIKKSYLFYMLLLISGLIFSCQEQPNHLLDPGISKELAEFRKANVQNVIYNLDFNIPEDQSQQISANLELKFDYKADVVDLILDFNAPTDLIKNVSANGNVVEAQIDKEHIVISANDLKQSNNVSIEFVAGEQSLNRHEEYLYTLFVPERASTCFPLFDQPDIKASYKLSLTIPENWEAVTNAPQQNVEIGNGNKQYEFNATQNISSYLFAFAAGKFDKIEKEVEGRVMTMFHRESDSLKLADNVEAIFQWHAESLNWLEEYTGIKYPFEKFDFVLLPSFQYGGMEHPGSIFYKASSLLLGKTSTINQQIGRGRLIAHETAHMWFGDLVTMPWFNDVWLKEVFANFMAAKIVRPKFNKINHELQFLMAHYPSAYEVDRTDGTHPIAQDLNNLKNAGSLYGSIIYQKAPIVMQMLERNIGEEAFQKGIRQYLSNYQFDNASWDDLIAIMGQNTNKDLNDWNNRWVKSSHMSETRYDLDIKNDKLRSLIIYSQNPKGIDYYPQALVLGLGKGDTLTQIPFNIEQKVTTIKGDTLFNPEYLFTNYSGIGYGYFWMGPASIDHYLSEINNIESSVLRGSLWINMFELILRSQLPPTKYLEALLKALSREKEPLIIEYLNNRLKVIFWNLLTEDQRTEYAAKIEGVLFNMTVNADNDNLKNSFFKAYYSVVTTSAGTELLYNLWKGNSESEIDLSEDDFINITYELSLRIPDSAQTFIDHQLSRMTNIDRIKKLKWVAPSINSDEKVRDSFFESLKEPKNRENEDWVLTAVRNLHHPLRQKSAVKYIDPGMELLEEIKITGDIFFPKRWLDATFWGHQSEGASDIVRQFLYKHHDYPKDLKNKLLQSTDLLMRIAEIQGESKDQVVIN